MLRLFSQGVAFIGWLVSVYLYFAKQLGGFVCPVGDCQTVNSSKYAQIGSVPISLLGILFYVGVLCLLFSIPLFSNRINRILLGILLSTGLLFSAYLTYVEIFWLHAVCFWCMVSFICVILLIVAYWLDGKKIRTDSVV